MPVAPASREEVPEAEPEGIRKAEARPEMDKPIRDLFEWPDEHVPFERVGRRHGDGR